jgi:hypothetical protein
MLDISGMTTGSYEKCTFAGRGFLVSLQRSSGVSWCNVHNFRRCNFNPYNQFPIVGSGEVITFDNCNWQAGSNDGIGRALQSSNNLEMKALTFQNCGYYDVTAGTDEAGHAFQFEAGRVFRSEAGHPWRQSHGSI